MNIFLARPPCSRVAIGASITVMDESQASSNFLVAASAAVDAMAKAENALLSYGDAEIANVISAARAGLEDAARALSAGTDEDTAP